MPYPYPVGFEITPRPTRWTRLRRRVQRRIGQIVRPELEFFDELD